MDEDFLSDNFLDHTEQWTTERVDETARAMAFRNLLRQMDSRLDLIYVKEGATILEGGFYYIVRHNDIGIKSHWQVHDGSGKPCVPDSRHLEMMKRNDLTNVDVVKELEDARARKEAQKQKKKEARSEKFRELLLEKIAHIHDAQVAVPNPEAEASRRQRLAENEPVSARA